MPGVVGQNSHHVLHASEIDSLINAGYNGGRVGLPLSREEPVPPDAPQRRGVASWRRELPQDGQLVGLTPSATRT
jgi:hypothetical protein